MQSFFLKGESPFDICFTIDSFLTPFPALFIIVRNVTFYLFNWFFSFILNRNRELPKPWGMLTEPNQRNENSQ